MKVKTLIGVGPIGILMIVLIFSSCRSQELKWKPELYSSDAEHGRIIKDNRDGTITEVSCIEEKFNEFHCMHIDKINELRRILKKRCK